MHGEPPAKMNELMTDDAILSLISRASEFNQLKVSCVRSSDEWAVN